MADRRALLQLAGALILSGCATRPGGAQSAEGDGPVSAAGALESAQAALGAGLPWRATRILAPVLA
ncbi:MAG TPA: hypothetical protein VJ773_09215, partial [Gemmatimonadales bacterium]|nr:hypothetical protein [Gemmatimonadales bacterium]